MKTGFVTLGIGLLLASVSLAGCSGGGGGGCGQLEPCGGQVAGSWRVTGFCLDAASATAAVQALCPGTTADYSGAQASGTATFNTDGTYSTVMGGLSPSTTRLNNLTPSCLAATTCAAVATMLQDPSTQVTCTGTTSCSCTLTATSSQIDSGTYSLSGTSLTLSSTTTGLPRDVPYCVQGLMMHFIRLDTTMNMGPMGQATIANDVVFTRQ